MATEVTHRGYTLTETGLAVPEIDLLLGINGAGKGVQSRIYKERLKGCGIKVHSLVTGEVIREATDNPSHRYHPLVAPDTKNINSGELTPDQVVNIMFDDAFEEAQQEEADVLLVDGHYRSPGQRYHIEKAGGERVYLAMLLAGDGELALKRGEWRRQQAIRENMRPREDDSPEAIARRVQRFEAGQLKVIEDLVTEANGKRDEGLLQMARGRKRFEGIWSRKIPAIPGIRGTIIFSMVYADQEISHIADLLWEQRDLLSTLS